MKKNIVLAGMLAAMVFVATRFLQVPIVGVGYVHMGDAVVYLAAALLPTPYAMASAAVGAGLADVLSPFASYAPFTVVIKAVMVLAFTAKKERLLCRRNAVAPLLAGIIGVAGYYVTGVALLCFAGNKFAISTVEAVFTLPFNAIQEVVGGVAFVLLAVALDRMNIKKRLSRM